MTVTCPHCKTVHTITESAQPGTRLYCAGCHALLPYRRPGSSGPKNISTTRDLVLRCVAWVLGVCFAGFGIYCFGAWVYVHMQGFGNESGAGLLFMVGMSCLVIGGLLVFWAFRGRRRTLTIVKKHN
jgi:hypothetical protein